MNESEGGLFAQALEMNLVALVIFSIGISLILMRYKLQRIERQQRIRAARVDGVHDSRIMRDRSACWMRSSPSVGWFPFTSRLIDMDGPNGLVER